MKKIFITNLIIILIIGCSELKYKIVPEEEVDKMQKFMAESLAVNI